MVLQVSHVDRGGHDMPNQCSSSVFHLNRTIFDSTFYAAMQWSPCWAHLFTRSNIHLPHKHPAVGIHESYIKTPSRKLRSSEIFSYWNGLIHQYCWWKKSCTTWDVWNPINNGINYLSAGAGFQPSTVVPTNRPPFWVSGSRTMDVPAVPLTNPTARPWKSWKGGWKF